MAGRVEADCDAFDMTPDWLLPKGNLTVVCGPPGAGKTTYVKKHAKPNDVVIDIDDLVAELFGVHGHDNDDMIKVAAAIVERNERLSRLVETSTAWLVAGAPSKAERAYWTHRGATVVLLNPGRDECFKRVTGRSRSYRQAVLRWFMNSEAVSYAPAPRRPVDIDGWPL